MTGDRAVQPTGQVRSEKSTGSNFHPGALHPECRYRGFTNNQRIFPVRTDDLLYKFYIVDWIKFMEMKKRQWAILAIIFWLFFLDFIMVQLRYFDLELYFCYGFIGILLMVEALNPAFVKPHYITHLRMIVIDGIVIFTAIVVMKVIWSLRI
jgi:hypothetical protein